VVKVDRSLENEVFGPGLDMQKQSGRKWGDRGSTSSVGIPHEAISNQGNRKLGKDMPDTMMTRLEKHVRGRVIGEVDHRLMWGLEPATQGNCNSELGTKS